MLSAQIEKSMGPALCPQQLLFEQSFLLLLQPLTLIGVDEEAGIRFLHSRINSTF